MLKIVIGVYDILWERDRRRRMRAFFISMAARYSFSSLWQAK
jgi:hypothetical protein